MKTDTPRTDSKTWGGYPSTHPESECEDVVNASFAHTLETELNTALALNEEMREALRNCLSSLSIAMDADENPFGIHHNATQDAISGAEVLLESTQPSA